jgi:hypothetical protein
MRERGHCYEARASARGARWGRRAVLGDVWDAAHAYGFCAGWEMRAREWARESEAWGGCFRDESDEGGRGNRRKWYVQTEGTGGQ